jgi:hypothetical protein
MKKGNDRVSIQINSETHKRLLREGIVKDTLDSVIGQLLDMTEEKVNK